MKVLQEFREFAVKGSVVDLAVGVIIGAAFGAIVKSFVDDIVMPVVGLFMGGIDLSDRYWVLRGSTGEVPGNATQPTAADMRGSGAVVVSYGQFLNTVLTFLIVAWAVFLMVKGINRMRRRSEKTPPDAADRPCPECLTTIPKAARRCHSCGTAVEALRLP